MTSKRTEKWAQYEALAHKIVEELMPFAEVTLDDHIHGKLSEGFRQLDVTAKWNHEGEDYLLIVQVKDLKRKADVNVVGTFRAVIEDVGAHRGVLICSGGFSKQAKTYAKNIGVLLYSLHEAESRHWPRELTVPVIWTKFVPAVRMSAHFQPARDGEATFYHTDKGPVVRTVTGHVRRNYDDYFTPMWNSQELDITPGTTHELPIDDDLQVYVRYSDGHEDWLDLSSVKLTYEVSRESWLGQLTPDYYRGLVDHLDNEVFVPAEIRFDALPTEPDENWQKISDPDRVALDVKGVLLTAEQYVVAGSLGSISASIEDLGPVNDDD